MAWAKSGNVASGKPACLLCSIPSETANARQVCSLNVKTKLGVQILLTHTVSRDEARLGVEKLLNRANRTFQTTKPKTGVEQYSDTGSVTL